MKKCPRCGRATRKKTQSAADYPGTVIEYLADGTCPRCDMIAKGWTPKPRNAPRPKTFSAAAAAVRIREARKARGVPDDGLTHIRIANSGGRTHHVPQLL